MKKKQVKQNTLSTCVRKEKREAAKVTLFLVSANYISLSHLPAVSWILKDCLTRNERRERRDFTDSSQGESAGERERERPDNLYLSSQTGHYDLVLPDVLTLIIVECIT